MVCCLTWPRSVRMKSASGWRSGHKGGDVLSLVLRNAALLLAPGLVLGAFLSVAAAQAARAMLFGLKPSDPAVLVAAMTGLGFIALLASVLPARSPYPICHVPEITVATLSSRCECAAMHVCAGTRSIMV